MFLVPVACHAVHSSQLRGIRAKEGIRIVVACELHPFGNRVPIILTASAYLIRAVPSQELNIGVIYIVNTPPAVFQQFHIYFPGSFLGFCSDPYFGRTGLRFSSGSNYSGLKFMAKAAKWGTYIVRKWMLRLAQSSLASKPARSPTVGP